MLSKRKYDGAIENSHTSSPSEARVLIDLISLTHLNGNLVYFGGNTPSSAPGLLLPQYSSVTPINALTQGFTHTQQVLQPLELPPSLLHDSFMIRAQKFSQAKINGGPELQCRV